MEQHAVSINSVTIGIEYATVTAKDGGNFTVTLRGESVRARKAAGCLLEPAAGDLALVSLDSFGRCYLLAVLERTEAVKDALVFERDLEIRVEHGRLSARADEGMDLASPGAVSVAAGQVNLHALEGEIAIHRLDLIADHVDAQADVIKLFGRACDTVFERISQRVKNSFKWVAELDQVHAGHIAHLAEKIISFQSRNTVITAKEQVRIDGDKILMG